MSRPRRLRFLRAPDGAIRDVRPATDPIFDRLWMEDEAVRSFFAAQDRAWRLSHGGTVEDEETHEHAEAQLRHRLMGRRAR